MTEPRSPRPAPNRLPNEVVDEIVTSNPRVAPRTRVIRRTRRALTWRNPSTPWWRTYTRLRPPEFLAAAAAVLACCMLVALLTGHLTLSRALGLLLLVYIPGTFIALTVLCLGLIVHAALTSLAARRTLRTATEHAVRDRRQLRDLLDSLGIRDPATLAVVLRLAASAPQNTAERGGRLLHLALLADPTGRYAPVYLPDEHPPQPEPDADQDQTGPEHEHEPQLHPEAEEPDEQPDPLPAAGEHGDDQEPTAPPSDTPQRYPG